jgi:hypothetical protein
MSNFKSQAERNHEADALLVAIEWLRVHASCVGPLGHLPTSDSGVQLCCRAIHHLTVQRRRLL